MTRALCVLGICGVVMFAAGISGLSASPLALIEGGACCPQVHLDPTSYCTGGELAPCPAGAYCSASTCRTDCTAVPGFTTSGYPPNAWGTFSTANCSAAGSTYDVLDCTGWVICFCNGVKITGPWPCPRTYNNFTDCE